MKSPVGWVLFGLTLCLTVVYLLNRGVYVGSSIDFAGNFKDVGGPLYLRTCTYVYLSGTRHESQMGRSKQEADFHCALLHP
jgi:hypothetical protein